MEATGRSLWKPQGVIMEATEWTTTMHIIGGGGGTMEATGVAALRSQESHPNGGHRGTIM